MEINRIHCIIIIFANTYQSTQETTPNMYYDCQYIERIELRDTVMQTKETILNSNLILNSENLAIQLH